MTTCHGPGCIFTASPASEWWCSPSCMQDYYAQTVDVVYDPNIEVISDEVRTHLARTSVEETPDPLIFIHEHLKVSD